MNEIVDRGNEGIDVYAAEEAEITALARETSLDRRNLPDFAARVAAIRLKHHEERVKTK